MTSQKRAEEGFHCIMRTRVVEQSHEQGQRGGGGEVRGLTLLEIPFFLPSVFFSSSTMKTTQQDAEIGALY